MTRLDIDWFVKCHSAGLVKAPMLEVGSAKVQGLSNLCEIGRRLGVNDATGVDLVPYEGVDLVADFSLDEEEFRKRVSLKGFSTVCVFNVLEHTFDAITVLSNALSCVDRYGALLVVVPSIWPIHDYPGDFVRLLPDWYREFAKRHELQLIDKHFCWLSEFGVEPISLVEGGFPTYLSRAAKSSRSRYWASRVGHKLLNTYGRSHWAPHSAIGAAFIREKFEERR